MAKKDLDLFLQIATTHLAAEQNSVEHEPPLNSVCIWKSLPHKRMPRDAGKTYFSNHVGTYMHAEHANVSDVVCHRAYVMEQCLSLERSDV